MTTDNTSRVNDYLTPVGVSPPYDADLEDILQWWAVQLTGLDVKLVRPRWQEKPPRQPAANVTWCAIGPLNIYTLGTPQITHSGDDITDPDNGMDTLSDQERIDVMASFYGPLSQQYANRLKKGCRLPQNNDQLRPYRMALSHVDEIRAAPTMRNEQWLKRFDLRLFINRKASETYQVRNLASASFEIKQGLKNGK